MLAALLAIGNKLFPFLTGININGVLVGVWDAIGALGKNIVTNWKAWLIGLLVLLQVGTAYGCYHEHNRYLAEVVAHKADNAKFAAAQQAANKEEQNIKQQLQTESKAAKNEADTNYNALLTKYNASLMRYNTTNKSSFSNTSGDQFSTSTGANGSGTNTELPNQITITGADAEICAVNTARLQASHDWALQQLQVEKTINEKENANKTQR